MRSPWRDGKSEQVRGSPRRVKLAGQSLRRPLTVNAVFFCLVGPVEFTTPGRRRLIFHFVL